MIALRLARAFLMAGAGAVVTLAQLNLPSKRFWDGQVLLQWASVLSLAFFVVHEGVRSVNYALHAARIRDYDNNLRSALSATVSAVVLSTGTPWDAVAVRYYRRRGLPFRRRLVRVAAILAGADIADAQRSVHPSEGIVGTAYSTQMLTAVQWRQFVDTATRQGPAAWAQLDERARFGLTWGQLQRSAKAEGVVASPTFDPEGEPDGCILLSGPLKGIDLTSDDTRRALDDLATVLYVLGPPPAGWWDAHEQ